MREFFGFDLAHWLLSGAKNMSKKKMSKAEQEALHAQQEEEERLILEAEVKRLEDLRLQKEEEVHSFQFWNW